MSKKKKPLNDQQLRFCEEYLIDLHGQNAAIRAGYSEDTARFQASRMLAEERVQEKVQELMAARSKRVAAKSDRTLREITRIGHSDIRKLITEDGTIKPASEWPDDIARAVASLEIEEVFEGSGENRTWTGYLKKIKLWDKPKALDMKARHENLYAPTKVDLGEETLEALLAATWDKPKEEKK